MNQKLDESFRIFHHMVLGAGRWVHRATSYKLKLTWMTKCTPKHGSSLYCLYCQQTFTLFWSCKYDLLLCLYTNCNLNSLWEFEFSLWPQIYTLKVWKPVSWMQTVITAQAESRAEPESWVQNFRVQVHLDITLKVLQIKIHFLVLK